MEKITSVVYYTSNREEETFEEKIRERLLSVIGDLPLISVSQKPIDSLIFAGTYYGKNICVGDIGVSGQNALKQMLIGCEKATTQFVTFAEADTLYPPEYFQYIPKELNKRYWFEDVYILFASSLSLQNSFYLKGRSDCAHMAGREYIISLIKDAFKEGRMMKYRGDNRPTKVKLYNPIINIKTGNGMNLKTQTSRIPVASLPYWGKAVDLRKELFEF